MKNIKKILGLVLCSSTILVGCNKRHAISLDEADSFCTKNYKCILKQCSKVVTDYNLSFSYGEDSCLDDAKWFCGGLLIYFSLCENDKTYLIDIINECVKIDTKNNILTIKKQYINEFKSTEWQSEMFIRPSLGYKIIRGADTYSYLRTHVEKRYIEEELNIYVSNSNNIQLNGILNLSIPNHSNLSGFHVPNTTEYFDDDGCTSKWMFSLKKGDKIKHVNDSHFFTLTEDSSVTATYYYF